MIEVKCEWRLFLSYCGKMMLEICFNKFLMKEFDQWIMEFLKLKKMKLGNFGFGCDLKVVKVVLLCLK